MTLKETKIKSCFNGKVIQVNKESVTAPDQRVMELEIVRHPGGAGALAVNEKQQVCLIRQFRHAAGGWIWEIPAGRRDLPEDPLATAQRELQEETGLLAKSWQSLGAVWSTPGFCDEVIHLYLAREISPTATRLEAHEYLEVHWLSWSQALQQAHDADIFDAKTVAALFYAAPLLQ